MMPNILIAIGAGAASALLFASVASGSVVAILLFYLAPLPILIAAIGWTHWTGLTAAVLAAAGLSVVIGPLFFIPFLIGIGLPAWWLGYLALLAKPAEHQPTPDGLDWYPVGRLVMWAALLAALVVASFILNLETGEAGYRKALRDMFEQVLRPDDSAGASSPEQRARLLDLLVAVVPVGAAVLASVINVVNLWLAARIVSVSGRLKRPWPEIAALQLPRMTPVLLALGCAGTALLDGLPAVLAAVLAASMAIAYALLGLAVLHTITRGMASRGLVLGGTYAVVLVLGWPILGLTLLGLAENATDIRNRFAARLPPPPPAGT